MAEYYIGLMSGTSVDGIDAALVSFDNNQCDLLAFEFTRFAPEIQKQIKQLSYADQRISLKDYGSLDCQLGKLFAQTCLKLLSKTPYKSQDICAVGSHGQTIYHAPELDQPFSLQIGDPNQIAQLTGICTVADFRRRDIAVGGQGAPLVPAFHQAIFHNTEENRCIVNIGGIANISALPITGSALGFDTGPGNTLMDLWINQHLDKHYDNLGDWARSGCIQLELVKQLLQDPYFSAPPPKSTGKEYFSLAWLKQKIPTLSQHKPEDIQATLCQLSAQSIADAIKKHCPNNQRILICGGGIHNQYLLELISKELHQTIYSTEEYGIHPDHVEAIAFAWLAKQTINNQPGNLMEATGAKAPVILGGIYL